MSYDVTIFFNYEKSMSNLAIELEDIFGFSFGGCEGGRVFGLDFLLQKRKEFIRDDEDMNFSKYLYQLEITARKAGFNIIHPVAYMVSQVISANMKGEVMLCLSSVEVLGAIFLNGNLVDDRMVEAERIVGSGCWTYRKQ